MTFVPHTRAQVDEMLETVGVESVEALFEAVPAAVRFPALDLPPALSELELRNELNALSKANENLDDTPSFLGAGSYNHFVPSLVDAIISRSEFYTAYTPYQPEISQGTLQAMFEYQSMIAALTGMEVSNASMYDGATSLAEAVLMAWRMAKGKRSQVVLAGAIHPEYVEVVRTYIQGMPLELVSAEMDALTVDTHTAAVVVQYPDFRGEIQDIATLAEAAHAAGASLIVVAYPIALGMLKSPGELGADIVVGEGQPLGNALAYGGPYLGFFACRKKDVRRMAGRVVGQTTDVHGERGFVLTLSTREQHIRREKATSNICSNEGLNALAAAVYLSAMGECGLRQVAQLCYHKAHYAAQRLRLFRGSRW